MNLRKAMLAALLVLFAAALPCIALADTPTELGVSISAQPAVLSEAGQVDLSVSVSLETGVIGNSVTVLSVSCAGVSSESAGAVYYGQAAVFSVAGVPVPHDQIGQPVPVELLYINLDGQLVSEEHYFTVSEPTSAVSVSRMVEPVAPKSGEMVRLLYVVSNSGQTDVTDVQIIDEAFGAVAQFAALGAGQQQSVETSFIMPNHNMTSQGRVDYVSAAGEPLSASYEALEIQRQRFALSIATVADAAQLRYGEAFWLSCTVTNSGRVTYTNVALSCDHLEDLPVIDKLAPGESYVFGRWIMPAASRDYVLEVTGTDASGESYTVSAAPVHVDVAQAPQLDERVLNLQSDAAARQVKLTVWADQIALEQDGLVSFEVTVSHPGIALKDVVIRETSQGKLESIQMLPSGDHLFKYSIRVSQSGSYQFSLSAKDENDVTVLALADPVEITVDMRRVMNSVMMQPVGSAPAAPAPKRARVETAVLFCVAALMVLSAVFLAVLIWRERISKPRR